MKSTLLLAVSSSLVLAACNTNPTQGKAQATVSAPPPAAATATTAEPNAATIILPLTAQSGSVGFVGAKITAKHPGKFADFSGKISLSPNAPEKSQVEVSIAISSLNIEPAKLQGHLLSPDLLDSQKFPTASFVSTKIEKAANAYTVTGNLTLHGVTQSISFPADITAGAANATVRAEFGINRKDFGIVYPGMPDDLIQDQVLIQIDLKAQKS
jgi:polyisoprenoid-binding protein YceI